MQDPFAKYRQPPAAAQPAPQLPTQPQPFAGAKPMRLERPAPKVLDDTLSIKSDIRADNADVRAAEAADLARQRMAIDAEKAEIERRTAALRGGVDVTAQENTAAGHMRTLQTNIGLINEALRQNPKANAPGFAEALLGDKVGPEFRGFLADPQRNVIRQSYGPILESAIYIATGAAANEGQEKRLAEGFIPVFSDGPEELRAKAIRLEAEFEKAKALAGPAALRAEQAVGEVRKLYPIMFGVEASEVMNPLDRPELAPNAKALSADSKQVPIPPEMQREFQAFLSQNPPGSLTTEKFLDFYGPLFERYDFGGPADLNQQAAEYVKAYNSGRVNTAIPNPTEQLEGFEAAMAAAGADKGIVGDLYTGTANAANALTGGIPELVAGREGRAALAQANAENPIAATIGEVGGALAPGMGLSAAGRKILTPMLETQLSREIGGEVLGNAVYGGMRGATGAEPENRLSSAVSEAGIGAIAPIIARGAIDGARGFMGTETRSAVDALGSKEFEIPAARGALPADEITPPRYQAMSDDELREELARTQRAIDAQGSQTAIVEQNQAMRQSIMDEARKVAQGNANRQEQFVRENFRSTQPGQIDAIRADAAQRFPTDPEELLRQPAFADRLAAIKDPATDGMEPVGILQARQDRLANYLAQDATPKTGTIQAVDLTTPQRMGLGESEESLQGLPFVHGQREKAVESFNRQNSARVLSRVGMELPKDVRVGTDMNAFVNQKLNEAYGQLRPAIKGRIDQSFNNGIAALRKQGTSTPEMAKLWDEIEATLANFRRADGSFDGEGYKELSTRMRGYSSTWGNNNNPASTVAMQDAARLAEQVRKQAQALVNRANPAVGRKLKAVEGAWAHQMRIDAASRGAAKSTRGVYSPDEYLNAVERLDTSRNKGAVARGKAFDQGYAQDARQTLGGKPAKKTSLRETAIAAFGVSYGGPAAAALITGLGAGYIPGVKRVVQAVMEGKLGKTPKAVEEALGNSKAGQTILKATSGKARREILTQLLRAEASE